MIHSISRVHPGIPFIIWLPVVAYFICQGAGKPEMTLGSGISSAVAGMLTWSLLEYILHRYLFHRTGFSGWSGKLVYLFHGAHHDAPQDVRCIMVPPVPGGMIMLLIYLIVLPLMPLGAELFLAFFALGYLTFESIHYATHRCEMKGRLSRRLKVWHLMHHQQPEVKFGVSSPLWDYVFCTATTPDKSRVNRGR